MARWRAGYRAVGRAAVAALVVALVAGSPGAPALGDEPFLRIVSPTGSSPVSAAVDVAVEAAAGPVLVDYSFDEGVTWVPLLGVVQDGGVWRALWDTSGHNGPALLRARSGDAEAETEIQIDNDPPEVEVDVSNGRFSPNGDGRRDGTVFKVRVSEAASLHLEVLDRSGVVRRAWKPQDVAPGATAFTWSGKSEGRRLPDGRYRVRVAVVDEAGLVTHAGAPVWIDTRSPRLQILGIASPSDAGRAVKIRYRVRDASSRVRLRLQLHDDFRMIRSRSFVRAAGRGTLWLKPRYRNGDRLFPGRYRIGLRATDLAANKSARNKPLVVLRRVEPKVYTRLANTGRKVALTFDDCIFPDEWARILDILKRRRVKATFFCPGDRISMHRSLARRVVREGHTPASHAWGHPMLTELSYSSVTALLASDRRQWASVGGVSAPYFRPPYGAYNSTVLQAAAATSHPRVMMWDIDSRDTAGASGGALVCNVVCNARPGSIVLLHTKPVTAAALPAILDGLEARGLKPVTLPQLFRAAGHR